MYVPSSWVCVSHDLLSSLESSMSRGYSLLRIRYFPSSDVAPGVISREPRRLHFDILLRPSIRLIFLLRCCLVLALHLHPYVSRADLPDRTNFHEITWRWARKRDERNRLIITFDRNYGNETANYKKGLQAALGEGGEDFLMIWLRYDDRDNDYARHLSYDFRDS